MSHDETIDKVIEMFRDYFNSVPSEISRQLMQENATNFLESSDRKEAKALEEAVWVVETKVSEDRRDVEVSAVIKGSHGHKSWGWHRPEQKYVVLRVSDVYQKVPVLQSIIELAENEARKICRENNK